MLNYKAHCQDNKTKGNNNNNNNNNNIKKPTTYRFS